MRQWEEFWMARNLLGYQAVVHLVDGGVIRMNGRPHKRCPIGQEEGFTLLEAVIVLLIIAVLGVVSVPAVINTLTYQKLSNATESLVNQVEFARVQAAARNRAYRLRVVRSDGVNSGAIHLDEGTGTACTPATFEKDAADPEPILDVRHVDFTLDHKEVRIIETVPEDLDATALCFKPDGRVLRVDSGTPVASTDGYAAGEAVYVLQLFSISQVNGSAQPTNLYKRVVVPYNGVVKVE
jgi:type II secretory pathway pseudopilin PulG